MMKNFKKLILGFFIMPIFLTAQSSLWAVCFSPDCKPNGNKPCFNGSYCIKGKKEAKGCPNVFDTCLIDPIHCKAGCFSAFKKCPKSGDPRFKYDIAKKNADFFNCNSQ